MTVRRIEHKMGIKGSPTCELAFNNAPAKLLGSRGLGLIKYVMSMMNGARLDIGAQSVGIMEAALREAVRYANERKQFGVSIATFPAVYSMLSRMRAKLDGSRALLYETARYVDIAKLLGAKKELSDDERAEMRRASKYADMYTPMLKLMAGEYANQVAYDAVQVYGGSGFIKEFAVFLSNEAGLHNGSIWENCMWLKGVVMRAHFNGHIPRNPFAQFHISPNTKEREYLTENELKTLMEFQFKDPKNSYLRDIFVFASFTALSFVDIKELSNDQIVEVNGEKWIISKRHKTGVPFQVKLLDIPLQIIERYKAFQENNLVFPNLNYWSICKRMGKMIKECGITKKISFHLARHITFSYSLKTRNLQRLSA